MVTSRTGSEPKGYLVAEAGKDDPSRVLSSMWGRLERCEGRGAQGRAGLLRPSLQPCRRHPGTPQGHQPPLTGISSGVGSWGR